MFNVCMFLFSFGLEITETIQLKTDEYFAFAQSLDLVHDGSIVSVLWDGSNKYSLLLIDANGNILRSYSEMGQGPGEFIGPSTVRVVGEMIVVGELLTDKFHVYNMNLEFVRDIRTSGSGDIFPIADDKVGIWGHHTSGKDLFLYGIYSLKTGALEGKFFPYEAKNVPQFVHKWGGLTYAAQEEAVYSIYVHDRRINRLALKTGDEILIPLRSKHLREYFPYKKSDSGSYSSSDIYEYLGSWTMVRRVYTHKEGLVVEYREGKEYFCDLYSVQGRLIKGKVALPNQLNQVSGETLLLSTVEESETGNVIFFHKGKIK